EGVLRPQSRQRLPCSPGGLPPRLRCPPSNRPAAPGGLRAAPCSVPLATFPHQREAEHAPRTALSRDGGETLAWETYSRRHGASLRSSRDCGTPPLASVSAQTA